MRIYIPNRPKLPVISANNVSETLGLPVIGGSDSHNSIQIGCIKNIFEYDCKTINELKEQIKNGKYFIETSNDLNEKIKDVIEIKKLIKPNRLQATGL